MSPILSTHSVGRMAEISFFLPEMTDIKTKNALSRQRSNDYHLPLFLGDRINDNQFRLVVFISIHLHVKHRVITSRCNVTQSRISQRIIVFDVSVLLL